jgi:peroxiredoxin
MSKRRGGRIDRGVWRRAASLVLGLGAASCGQGAPDTLAIGAAAPAFSLPGVDGRTHSLGDYAGSRVLVVVFTCNHCPVAQLYEQRIQRLHADYRSRSVAVVAINPDSEKTVALKDLAYSDVPDTLAGMRARAAHRRLDYPYLYDGDGQAAAAGFKAVATPQVFVFDAQRKLRYTGRLDDNVRADLVKASEARAAIDALLTDQPIRVASTAVEGCAIRRLGQSGDVQAEHAELEAAPVKLQLVGAPELKALRANGTANLMMINFWATWCAPCIVEFPELQKTYRMYRSRGFEYVTVSVDSPEARPGVMKLLEEQRATSRNHLFATEDAAGLQDAFDRAMPAAVPFTLLLTPNGEVAYQHLGEAEFLPLRRAILASLPDDPRYPGLQTYWTAQ